MAEIRNDHPHGADPSGLAPEGEPSPPATVPVPSPRGKQRPTPPSRQRLGPAIVIERAAPGDRVETTIERIVPGGLGLAHAGGRTLFVPLAAPGDRLRVVIERVQGGVAFAGIEEVLEPSPDRVAAPYPALAACGGCDFQHLSYGAQLRIKGEMVRDCLRRIGGIDPPPELPIAPSPAQWGYRARAEWHLDRERGVLGYVARETHRVCDTDDDPIVVPALAARLDDLRHRLAAGTLPVEADRFRAAAGDDGTSLAPNPDGGEPTEVGRAVGEERYAYDADCFFQVNPGLLEPLVAEALRFAPERAADGRGRRTGDHDRRALELYCGVGLFTLPLARRFRRVIAVEAHPRSAAFAARNAANAGLSNIRIETQPVDRWVATQSRTAGLVPFVLLDPPRGGLEATTLRGLLRLRPARIAYVACDPATLARDLKALLGGGYRLLALAAFDLFPQTHHVEVVAHLDSAG